LTLISSEIHINLIALAWDDLNPTLGGTISYATTGTAPNRIFVVEYDAVPHFGNPTTTVSVQAHLIEGTNTVEIHTLDVMDDGGTITQGIENIDGTIGFASPGRNNLAWSATNDVVSFTQDVGDTFEDITVSNDAGECGAIVDFVIPEVLDNCSAVTITASTASGSLFPIGTTTVTVTATDVDGNSESCEFDVTVTDDELPTITCPADEEILTSVAGDGACQILLPDYTAAATATDNCPTLAVTQAPAAGTAFMAGTSTTVTLTADDGNGNTVDCSFEVTFTDDEAPVISCGPGGAIVYGPGPGGPIADDTDTFYSLTIADDVEITDLNVLDLKGTHSWTSDLTFTLTSPAGTAVTLLANESCL